MRSVAKGILFLKDKVVYPSVYCYALFRLDQFRCCVGAGQVIGGIGFQAPSKLTKLYSLLLICVNGPGGRIYPISNSVVRLCKGVSLHSHHTSTELKGYNIPACRNTRHKRIYTVYCNGCTGHRIRRFGMIPPAMWLVEERGRSYYWTYNVALSVRTGFIASARLN